MESCGVRLRAFMHVRELIALCRETGLIDDGERDRLEAFVDSE